jgi:predicted GTPase
VDSGLITFFLSVVQVDTAGWMERSGKEKGPASLSVVQSRKNLMRAHIVALVLDAEKVLTFNLICRANEL